jgi:hypothetical protein
MHLFPTLRNCSCAAKIVLVDVEDGGRSMSMTHSDPVLDANAHAKSMLPKPTEDGIAMVGHGPGAVFLRNTADLSHHRRPAETLLQETLASMDANDPVTGGLLSGPSTAMRRTRWFPSHANTLPKWGRRKKHHAACG